MKIFKKLLGLACLSFLGLAGLTVTSPAQAFTINCFSLNAVMTWPDRDVLSCGPAGGLPDATTQTVLTAIKGINTIMPNAYGKLLTQQPAVFVFRTTAEMQTYYNERGLMPPSVSVNTIGGQTPENGGVPLYTQIFANNVGAYAANTAVHEMGHWADYFYRTLGVATNRTSEIFLFRNLVNTDRGAFDRLTYPVAPTPVVPQCGVGSIFTGAQNGAGAYICNGVNGTGNTFLTYPNGTANADVLDLAFPNQFNPQFIQAPAVVTGAYREMFAESFAVENGNLDGGVRGIDKFFAAPRFDCTRKFVRKVGSSGILPTQGELEAWGCVVPCRAYPTAPGPNYPLNGHLFNCMGYPRSAAENTFQGAIMGNANSAIAGSAGFNTDEKNKLNAKNVDIYVYYNGADALLSKRLDVSGSTVTSTQMGKSFVEPPVGNSTLPRTSSIVWVYNKTDWAAKAGTIPAAPVSAQWPGTVNHEVNHQIDRIWAHDLGYAPAATALISLNSTQQAYYQKAIAWDWAAMSAADKATMWSTYPFVMINSTTVDNYQFFAEQVTDGLADSAGFIFFNTKFTCATWVIVQMEANNGAFPAAPSAAKCYNHTTW